MFDKIYSVLDNMKPPTPMSPDEAKYAEGFEDAVAEIYRAVEALDVEMSKEEKS